MTIFPILVVIAGLLVLVVVHEFGHFITAKRFGMHAPVFSVGFGPTLLHRRWRGTDYRLSAIPLGGYVRITGMTREEQVPPEAEGRAYWQRPVYQRVIVTSAGVAMNVLTAWLILSVMFFVGTKETTALKIHSLSPGKPAEAAGLRPDDRFVSIDGKSTVDDQATAVNDADGRPVVIVVERDGRPLTFTVQPEFDKKQKKWIAGFTRDEAAHRIRSYGPVTAVGKAVTSSFQITGDTFRGLGRIAAGQTKDVSSIVGITDATSTVLQDSFRNFMVMLAIISMLLAVFNVLPLLPLDGGHIVLALAEKVRRGRPVSTATMERFAVVGFVLMIGLFLIGLNNDLTRIFGGAN
jgi:regulator of sigma E protease